jgi:drug/metabolite transporter (DMT)-like permease
VIALAVLLAILASISFASGASAQHIGVDRAFTTKDPNRRVGLSQIITLLRTRVWLFGLLLVALGACIHLTAVYLAPITVVQPIGILAVIWSVLIAARLNHTTPTRTMWLAVACSVIGIVFFTILSTRHASHSRSASLHAMVVTTGVVWAVAAVFALLGLFGPRWMRNLAWSWGGSVLYGLGTGYMKIMTVVLKDGQLFTGPEFWAALLGLVLAYGVGGWLIQQGYASGPAEVVVGSMTTIDPLAAVLVGLVVLGEGARITPAVGIGMALAVALAAGGVAVLSRFHPDTQRHLAAQAAGG